jgi:polar amino acid transport system substrate-binding protein
MNTTRVPLLFSLVVITLAVSACQQSTQSQLDKLSQIQERDTLVVSVDPAYPPQSEINSNATRAPDTKCTIDQLTANELTGFDVDVAVEIAKRLGVEACFVTPDWMQIISGNWRDQWDISVGSMTITPERMKTLFFTQPYYATPATFFVHSDNTSYSNPNDLSGKKIGVCSGCTYQLFLEGTLNLPGQEIGYTVKNAEIVGYANEVMALQELALGDGVKLDAAFVASPTGKQAILNGLPVKQIGDPVYLEYLAAAVDRKQIHDPLSFVNRVTEIIRQMHSDGTLKNLSMQYYGEDFTTTAAEFNTAVLK